MTFSWGLVQSSQRPSPGHRSNAQAAECCTQFLLHPCTQLVGQQPASAPGHALQAPHFGARRTADRLGGRHVLHAQFRTTRPQGQCLLERTSEWCCSAEQQQRSERQGSVRCHKRSRLLAVSQSLQLAGQQRERECQDGHPAQPASAQLQHHKQADDEAHHAAAATTLEARGSSAVLSSPDQAGQTEGGTPAGRLRKRSKWSHSGGGPPRWVPQSTCSQADSCLPAPVWVRAQPDGGASLCLAREHDALHEEAWWCQPQSDRTLS